jgi:hypothetical protein
MKKIFAFLCFIVLVSCYSSCFYRKGDELVITCDTSNAISYSQKVLPIFQNNCYTCHTNSSSGGGWLMGNYNRDKSISQSARLVGAINHASGFSAMPKNGAKLSACEIGTIAKWINEGCPNN